ALLAPSVGQYAVRSYLSQSRGLTAVGFFAAAFGISNRIPILIYQTFGTYVGPTISALGRDWRAITIEQNSALRMGLLGATPLLCSIVMFLPWIVPFLLSSRFEPIIPMLRLMLVGELVSVIYWATSISLYSSGRPLL